MFLHAGIETEDDVKSVLLPLGPIEYIQEHLKMSKGVLHTFGGHESCKEWADSADNFIQFWIDMDLTNLPVTRFTNEEIMLKWEHSSLFIFKCMHYLTAMANYSNRISVHVDKFLHILGINWQVEEMAPRALMKELMKFPIWNPEDVSKALLGELPWIIHRPDR